MMNLDKQSSRFKIYIGKLMLVHSIIFIMNKLNAKICSPTLFTFLTTKDSTVCKVLGNPDYVSKLFGLY